jgi:serine phosphatase RsbU (regulator of sigma subunit)
VNTSSTLTRVVERAGQRLVEAGATFVHLKADDEEWIHGVRSAEPHQIDSAGIVIEWLGPLRRIAVESELETIVAVADGMRRIDFQRSLLERLADITSMPAGLTSSEAIQAITDRARKAMAVSRISLEIRTAEAIHRAESGAPKFEAERLVTIPTVNAHSTMTIPALLEEDLIDLIQLVAAHLATAIENALAHEQSLHQARIEEEYEIASRVQQAVLTRRPVPAIEGLDLDATSRPARIVGGDFYEFLPAGPDATLVVVGDVSGKGLPAAILTSLTLSTISAKVEFLPNPTPELIMARAAEDLYQPFTDVGMFTTAVVARIEPRRLVTANAGHGLVIHRPWGRPPRLITPTDAPIGVLQLTSGDTTEVVLDPGDLVLVASDGITDQRSPIGDLFGLERLKSLIDDGDDKEASAWVDRILAAVDAHADGREQDDDQTLLAIRATAGGTLRFELAPDLEALRELPGHLTPAIPEATMRSRVELAVHELCVNAITHGECRSAIAIMVWGDDGRTVVEVAYDGITFDPSAPVAVPDEPTVHGYGLGIIHQLSDEVVYVRRRLNQTRLFFQDRSSPE